MANGRPNKETGYCDYQFLDGTYCPERIEKITITKDGKQLEKNKWEDDQKRNLCIFHSGNNEKVSELYSRLRKVIYENNKSIINYHEGFKLSNISEEEKKKKMDEVRSNYRIDLEGCFFPDDLVFQKLTFESDLTFEKCIFNRNVSFYMAEFKGKVNFNEVQFNGDSEFSNVIFHNNALFSLAQFHGEANFKFVKFNGVSAFSSAHFGINKKMNGDAIFTGTKFRKESYFNYVQFYKKSFFRSGEFTENASFKQSLFGEATDFDGVQFKENVDFSFTIFDDTASFIGSMYEGGVSFKESIFKNNTNFSYSIFLKKLDFSDAIFLKGDLKFTRSRFPSEETFFLNSIFKCKVLFNEQMLKDVRFTGCYLGGASFYGSDVRDAVFINSSWNRSFLQKQIKIPKNDKRNKNSVDITDVDKKLLRLTHRSILFDEKIYNVSKKNRKVKTKKSSNYELDPLYLEHLYCQFKLAMDKNKMYGLANDFYYGEKLMETKRLWEEGSLFKWSFLKLYKLLAGFGNSPWRAIFSLIIVLLASSFLLIWSNGLTAVDAKAAYERCPCDDYKAKSVSSTKQNFQTSIVSIKTEKFYFSVWLNKSLAPFNTFTQSSKPQQSAKQPVNIPQKKEPVYSLRDSYWCNTFYVSLWNLTASPGRKSSDYKENGILAYLAIFLIQYIFRPLMVALIIISVRRKVYRG